MQSGSPQSQGGADPAFQHQSNVDSLTSHQDNVRPLPVVHPASGIQINMVATQYPEELRVVYGPAQRQQDNVQSRQNFQGLHQQKSQARIASTGFQPPKPQDSAFTPLNSCHQLSRKANSDFYLLPHVTAQCNSYFETSAYNRGQQREFSTQNFSRLFQKGSNLSYSGLQQRHLNSGFSGSTSPVALKAGTLGVTAQTSPLQDQSSSLPENKQQTSCPLLHALLKGNYSDFKFFFTTPSSMSEENSASRHCKSQHMKSSLDALNCGQTRKQNNSRETHSTSNPPTPSLCGQPCTDKGSPVGETEPSTDDQIQDFIAKRCEYFRTVLTQKKGKHGHAYSNKDWGFCNDDRNSTLQSDCNLPKSNSVARLAPTSASDKEYVRRQSVSCAEQCTAMAGQVLQEGYSKDSKANAELTPKSKETGDCTTIASEKHSTEYPQIMAKVAATCTKNEDESPVVLTAVALDKLTEKHPGLMLNRSSSQEEYKSPWLNINKDLDEIDQMPGVFWALTHMTENDNRETGPKSVEAVALDNVQGMTDLLDDFLTKSSSVVTGNKTFVPPSLNENQDTNTKKKRNTEDQHCHITCQDIIAHSKLNSSIDQIHNDQIHNVILVPTHQSERLWNQTSHEGVLEDAGSVHSQTDSMLVLSENKVQEPPLLPESKGEDVRSVKILKDPQYEDISDDEDLSQLLTNLPITEHEELNCPPSFEDLHCEDRSEDENPQIQSLTVAMPSLTQVPGPNNRQSSSENEGYGNLQGQTQMKTENISDERLIPKKQVPNTTALDIAKHCPCCVKTEDGFENLLYSKSDSERHLGLQANHSVSCSPSSVLKDGDETDDQMNDDWIVIPISMSDLKFEPDYESQDIPEEVVLNDSETGDKKRQGDISQTHCELQHPASQPVPASASSEIEVFDTLGCFLQTKAAQFGATFEVASGRSTPEHERDSEGEPDTPKNMRESYSEPEDSCDTEDSCDYPSATEQNYLTVSGQFLKKRSACLPLETDDSVSEKESEHEATNVQKGQTGSSDKLGCMEKLRELIEDKAGSKYVRPKTNSLKVSKKEDIIILDSDTEDESDQNCKKKAKGKRLFSSGSVGSADAPCCQQRGHSPETVDSQYGPVKEKFQINRLPSADLTAPQRQSKHHDTQFKEVFQDACSDLSLSIKKSGQLFEAKGSKYVNHKTDRQITSKRRIVFHDSDKGVKKDSQFSKKKVMTERTFSSVSKDSGNALFDIQNRLSSETGNSLCGAANEKTQKPILSAEDSPEKLPQSVGKDTDSTLSSDPVVRHLFGERSSQPKDDLKLLKESNLKSKNTDSCENNTQHLYRNKQGRFAYKPKPSNDRHCATKNKVQANVTDPRLVSRQRSLPSQEGPSSSVSAFTSTKGQLSEARQSSDSSRGFSQSGETTTFSSLSVQSTSVPRQNLSSLEVRRSHSYSNPSTLDHPYTPTKGPSFYATMQSSAREQVTNDWQKSFVPTRRYRKTSMGIEEALRTMDYKSWREGRPGSSCYDRARRQRHNSQEFETPLMKRTKNEAIQWTKDINGTALKEQTYSVGEGYKWKQPVAGPIKGSVRERQKYTST
ncbi:uncharacterized protein LOC120798680 isoform X2 [Xiphias gladius]|uniref:uncharacterized protein LOC120798680 isoform X2 n=1 Tax=Xiphias gladius TaxID=8245 RepID=UPI001A98F695|nr:uncharacterized protein LOC120798680 isoform X2 [Xiphias gladius]